jgi:hypothetical protein
MFSTREYVKLTEFNHHNGAIHDIFIPRQNNEKELHDLILDLIEVNLYGDSFQKHMTMDMECTYEVNLDVVYEYELSAVKKIARWGFFYNYAKIDGLLLYSHIRDIKLKDSKNGQLEDCLKILLAHKNILDLFLL